MKTTKLFVLTLLTLSFLFGKILQAKEITEKVMAWELGRKLTLSAIMNSSDNKDTQAFAASLYEKSKVIADALKIKSLPPLPKRKEKVSDNIVEAMNYIIADAGKTIATSLYKTNKSLGAIFEIAVKSHLLMATYTPGGDEGKIICESVTALLKQSTIPEKLIKPLLDKINSKASFEEVKRTLFEVGDSISAYLATQK